jgi:hypothetical protein
VAHRRRASDLLAKLIDALALAGDTLLSQRSDGVHLDPGCRAGHVSAQTADEHSAPQAGWGSHPYRRRSRIPETALDGIDRHTSDN